MKTTHENHAPNLLSIEGRQKIKHVLKNIRLQLAHSFPNVEFEVTHDSGDIVVVVWKDGPTKQAVEAVTAMFCSIAGKTWTDEGTGALTLFNRTAFHSRYGAVKRIILCRTFSDDVKKLLASRLNEKWGTNLSFQEFLDHESLFTEWLSLAENYNGSTNPSGADRE